MRPLAFGLAVLSGLFALPVAFGLYATLAVYVTDALAGRAHHADFLAYYSTARLWLDQPASLYQPAIERAYQQQLAGGTSVYDRFVSLPHVALLFVPLALLPYGPAYVGWLLVNLACLTGALRALVSGRWYVWLPVALLYPPVAACLLDGQTSLVALLAFALWVRTGAAWPLVGWLIKPQLLPVALLALVRTGRWRPALALSLAVVGLSGLVLLRAGPAAPAAWLASTRATVDLATSRTLPPGETVLGLAQSLIGPGWPAGVLALGVSGALLVRVAWHAPLSDAQLALLPIVAILTAARAGAYELTLWLASAALLTRAADLRSGGLFLALALLWWGGTLSVVAVWSGGLAWGALAGLVLVGLIVRMQGKPGRDRDARTHARTH